MNREEFLEFHAEQCHRMMEICKKKNHDYAGEEGEDPFANFTRVEAMGIATTTQGFLTRMLDKMSRLSTFAQSGKLLVEDEGPQDTLLDLANYSILLMGYLESQKEKNAGEPVLGVLLDKEGNEIEIGDRAEWYAEDGELLGIYRVFDFDYNKDEVGIESGVTKYYTKSEFIRTLPEG